MSSSVDPDVIAPHIVSASRRTDIPAFYMPWFLGRLRAGFARYPHPFTGEPQEVSLRLEHVHSIVFWSKDYAPFLEHADEVEDRGYPYGCHFTITAIPRTLEPGVPEWQQAARSFEVLSRRIGPRRVWWRFDPILLTDEFGAAHYLESFRAMAAALEGLTERCYFSFTALYGKARRRLEAEAVPAYEPELADKQALAQELAQMAAERGMTLHACCCGELVSDAVHKARCVDAGLLTELFPGGSLKPERRPTRKGCGCDASRDIGMYDTCPHGCIYCYANQDRKRVAARWERHDAAAEALVPEGG